MAKATGSFVHAAIVADTDNISGFLREDFRKYLPTVKGHEPFVEALIFHPRMKISDGSHAIRAAAEPRDETEDEEEDDYYWGPSDEQLQAEAEAEEEYQNYEWHKSRGDLMEPAESR